MAALALAFIYSCTACTPKNVRTSSEPLPGEPVTVAHLVERTVRVVATCPDGGGWGSGVVIISALEGSVVATAAHVVDSTECTYHIERSNGDIFFVDRVKRDAPHDVAVLYTLGGWEQGAVQSVLPGLGDEVVTVGFPGDLLKRKSPVLTVTRGNVAAIYDPDSDSAYRVTAAILPGSSGGGCWSTDGRLIGLTVSLWTYGGTLPFDSHTYVTAAEHVYKLMAAP